MSPDRTLGLLLIAIGSALLLVLTTDLGGEIVVLLIGVGFLVAYVATSSYGLLIPGAILAGLGTGILVESWGGPPEAVTMGLGTGFLAIAVVDRVRGSTGSGWWWPLIPGSVLLLTSASTVTGLRDLERYLLPAILIVVGASLLLRHGRAPAPPPPAGDEERRRRHDGSAASGTGHDRLAAGGWPATTRLSDVGPPAGGQPQQPPPQQPPPPVAPDAPPPAIGSSLPTTAPRRATSEGSRTVSSPPQTQVAGASERSGERSSSVVWPQARQRYS